MIDAVGCDIVDLARFAKLANREAFITRVLTLAECALYNRFNQSRRIEWLAGRFAAKEAASKALGCGIGGDFSFQDVSILPNEQGAPVCHCSEKLLAKLGGKTLILSISHSATAAMAVAMVKHGE